MTRALRPPSREPLLPSRPFAQEVTERIAKHTQLGGAPGITLENTTVAGVEASCGELAFLSALGRIDRGGESSSTATEGLPKRSASGTNYGASGPIAQSVELRTFNP
jgi:hypothetical protein